MGAPDKLTTKISKKGRVTLPVAIRRHRGWDAGTRLLIEDTPNGVLLRSVPPFPPTSPEEIFGSLPHHGRPKTIEEMNAGIEAEARRRHRRGRY